MRGFPFLSYLSRWGRYNLTRILDQHFGFTTLKLGSQPQTVFLKKVGLMLWASLLEKQKEREWPTIVCKLRKLGVFKSVCTNMLRYTGLSHFVFESMFCSRFAGKIQVPTCHSHKKRETSRLQKRRIFQLINEKNPSCLGYIGDCTA